MRIHMLRNALGSPDGVNVYHYEAGSVYTASDDLSHAQLLPISQRLAALFVAEGWAVDADAESGVVSVAENAATPPVEPLQASAEPGPVAVPIPNHQGPAPEPTPIPNAPVPAPEPVPLSTPATEEPSVSESETVGEPERPAE